MNENYALSPSLIETIAGFTAGIISTLVVHPLDIVKTRLQGSQNHPPHHDRDENVQGLVNTILIFPSLDSGQVDFVSLRQLP
jgi:hypothetical protein